MAEWSNARTCSRSAGKVYGFQMGQGSSDKLKGIKANLPDRSLIQYPWDMHICNYQQKKIKCDTSPVLRRGMPSAFHVKSG